MFTFIKSPNSPNVFDVIVDGRVEFRIYVQNADEIDTIPLDDPDKVDHSFRFMENEKGMVVLNDYQWAIPITEAFFNSKLVS